MIHQYKLNGYNIVLDTYSGSVHVVDDLAYEIIMLYENTPMDEILSMMQEKNKYDFHVSEKEIRETIADIEELKRDGKLFTEDDYKDLSIDLINRPTYVKALCLNVAHTCNLSCEYCFASQGKYNGNRAIMSYEIGKRAIDFLLENSGNHRNLDVDFLVGSHLWRGRLSNRLSPMQEIKKKSIKKLFVLPLLQMV